MVSWMVSFLGCLFYSGHVSRGAGCTGGNISHTLAVEEAGPLNSQQGNQPPVRPVRMNAATGQKVTLLLLLLSLQNSKHHLNNNADTPPTHFTLSQSCSFTCTTLPLLPLIMFKLIPYRMKLFVFSFWFFLHIEWLGVSRTCTVLFKINTVFTPLHLKEYNNWQHSYSGCDWR